MKPAKKDVPHKHDILTAWAMTDLTSGQIATKYGTTRSAVIGLGYRLCQRLNMESRLHLQHAFHGKRAPSDWDKVEPGPALVKAPKRTNPTKVPAAERRDTRDHQIAVNTAKAQKRENDMAAERARQRELDEAVAKMGNESAGISLMDLQPGMCRNVTGARYCGAPIAKGKSYCEHHHGLFSVGAIPKNRVAGAARLLRASGR